MKREQRKREKQEAIDLLYTSCATVLPYIERLFSRTRPPSQDYFELPKLIMLIEESLEKGRYYATTVQQRRRIMEQCEIKTRADDNNLDDRGRRREDEGPEGSR